MFEKIKTLKISKYLVQLNDVRTLGLVAFGVIVLLVTWSGVKAVQTNYDLQKQISNLTAENQVRELENQNLRLKDEYLKTDQFLELAARRQFGLAAPGEKVLLVPKSVALKHVFNVDQAPVELGNTSGNITKPKYQQNFEAWVNFFLHRQVK